MALYRTYRPATFADVVGQEHVTDPLSRALDSGRINHAYLFSGPRGCGKTSSARILARSLNCAQGPTSTPCGTCSSCVALAPGGPGNLDVIELDAASHGGVDDTRELRDRAFYAPAESRYRVFIVDEAHMVTNAGFNALLKIVEEPPEHLIFVFATTEPEKVLPTIRSRTHHYPFRLLAPPVMRGLLENICAKENVTVGADVYPLVIRAGGGSPRDSLSILDQLLAGADERGVTYDRALALLGVTDIALIDDAIDALAAGDGSSLFGTVEKVVDAGHDPRRFAVDLLERLRDLILLQAVPDAVDRGLVEAPGDQLARMAAQVAALGSASLTRFAEIAHNALGEMRGTTSPRLLLEVMCARMLLPAVSADDAALLQRLERLESGAVAVSAPGAANAPGGNVGAPGGNVGAPAAPPSKPVEPEVESKFVRPSQRKAMEEAKAAATSPTVSPEEPADGGAERDEGAAAPAMVHGGGTPTAPQPPARQPADRVDTDRVDTDRVDTDGVDTDTVDTDSSVADPLVDGSVRDDVVPTAEVVDVESSAPEVVEPLVAQSPRPEVESLPDKEYHHSSTAFDDGIPLPEEPADDDEAPPDEPGVRRPAPTPPPEPEAEAEQPTSTGPDLETIRKRFQDVRSAVRQHSAQGKTVEAMLSAAVVAQVSDDAVVLSHPVEGLVGRLSAPHSVEIIRNALREVFEVDLDVSTVHQAPGAAAAAGPAAGANTRQQQPRKAQTFSRPSRTREPGPDTTGAPTPPPEPEPEEPEPPRADEDIPDAERAEMVAEAKTASPDGRLDPDKVALELLKSELGARVVE
ncbi:DNA polymerase III subunit gamma and tau [Gordonia sp. ABSL1-1]|uniref:DNA polymerase III subunit gamma and tau n=1 Tax=Gordonia sp. ABSL1-1 TaxID=3053923 RepID=UPI0025742B48|nr:DNA polymerase III subunit gamma and tau [Gordonia sp. ABSL1-1]MDL9937604.1 DNA polymerase III subunit gamma and tau [Gordonia sp. ABSL1-1]